MEHRVKRWRHRRQARRVVRSTPNAHGPAYCLIAEPAARGRTVRSQSGHASRPGLQQTQRLCHRRRNGCKGLRQGELGARGLVSHPDGWAPVVATRVSIIGRRHAHLLCGRKTQESSLVPPSVITCSTRPAPLRVPAILRGSREGSLSASPKGLMPHTGNDSRIATTLKEQRTCLIRNLPG